MRKTILFALAAVLAAQVVPTSLAARTQQAAPAAESPFVSVPGVRNFRDAGGYRTADGHTVRRGILYRSGALGGMTEEGRAAWARLRIASIVDLRSAEERKSVPEDWLRGRRTSYWARDYSMGDPARPISRPSVMTPDVVRKMMYGGYTTMPKQLAPSYREMFRQLLAGHTPLVLNCTAGKDRTGIGVALVLTALGVPYETVRQDFLLSNAGIKPAQLRKSLPPAFASLPDEALMPLAGVEGGYLDTAFEQIRKDFGSVDAYLNKELGVGPRQVARLKRRMLR